MSEKIPEIFSNEQSAGKKKMDVVIEGKKYRPEFEFQLQEVEHVPVCVCCGEDGESWQECVVNIIDHGSEDVEIMREIEEKLKNIVREIEDLMAVCAKCYDDEFKRQRTKLYVNTVKDVTTKYNGEETDLSFMLNE